MLAIKLFFFKIDLQVSKYNPKAENFNCQTAQIPSPPLYNIRVDVIPVSLLNLTQPKISPINLEMLSLLLQLMCSQRIQGVFQRLI